jgi:hypothetical protein
MRITGKFCIDAQSMPRLLSGQVELADLSSEVLP